MSAKVKNFIIEMFALTSLMVVMDLFLFPGCFRDWNPSPLWILVLLLASRYGSPAGILAGGIAAGLHLWAMTQGDHTFQELLRRTPGMLVSPVLFIFVGMYLGESRERLARRVDNFREKVDDLGRQLDANEIKRLNLERGRVVMEKRIAGHADTLMGVYESLNRLSAARDEEELWGEFASVVQREMRADACGVWRMSPRRALAISGAMEEEPPPLVFLAVKNRDVATVAEWSETRPEESPGADLAALVVDDLESPVAVAVAGMGFTHLNRNAVVLFDLMTQRAAHVFQNLRGLMRLRQASVSDPELGLGSETYLRNRLREQTALARRHASPLCLAGCVFKTPPPPDLADRLGVIVACAIHASLRASDGIAYFAGSGAFVAMLPETDVPGAEVVVGKVVSNLAMLDIRDREGRPLPDLRWNIQALKEGMVEDDLYRNLFLNLGVSAEESE